MTAPSCFTKSEYCNYYKKDTDNYPRELVLIAWWIDYEGILSQIALYPITGLINQAVNKNVFILTLSRTEVVKKLAY